MEYHVAFADGVPLPWSAANSLDGVKSLLAERGIEWNAKLTASFRTIRVKRVKLVELD